jgi:membrane protein implicated in regulation of membrane protease activity
MDFKFRDIALIVFAVAVPVTILVLAIIPGGLGFVIRLAMDPLWGPVIFFGGAALVMAVLLWRFYRRIRPAEKKEAPKPHVSPAKMPKVEGSEALRRHRDGER